MARKPVNRYTLDEVLSPQAKEALRHFEMHARTVVEGMLQGIHRSRRIGVSTDFDHHKNYLPGDPLKHIDWKVSARHDKYFVKRYREDTALRAQIVVDRSASMLRASEDHPSKYLQAARVASCLAYLLLGQRDAPGLTVTSAEETFWVQPRSTQTQLLHIMQALASRDAADRDGLDICLKALVDRGERRGLMVVISDLMFDPEPVQRELGRLGAQGHELVLVQLRDVVEEDFPFNRWVEFRSLEGGTSRRLDTIPLKRIYREEYQAMIAEWRQWARKYNCHFITHRTDEPTETVLSNYLARRAMGSD